ncbi:MAG: UMP kinase [Candidatus Hydrothermarchaeales archaeon]
MKVVIGLGGSIVAPEKPDLDFIKDFSEFIIKLHNEGHKIMVVVGGGKAAKDYIKIARQLGANEDFCDELGIRFTRANAMLLTSAMREYALDHIPEGFDEATETDKIYVMGGTVPGHTTDAVATMLARHTKADLLIIATNVDGVYDKDPNTSPDARRFERISSEELLDLVSSPNYSAGATTIVDPKAAGIIHEEGIKTIVLLGKDTENMENAISGRDYRGTLVY